jgi:hypothetical protein
LERSKESAGGIAPMLVVRAGWVMCPGAQKLPDLIVD